MALVDNFRSPGDADDTRAFSEALRNNALVEWGEKTYSISNSIALTSAKRLVGRGAGISIIIIAPNFVELSGLGYSGPYRDLSGTLNQTKPLSGLGDRSHAAGRDLSISLTNLSGVGIKVINSRDIIIRPAIVNGSAWDGIFTYNVRDRLPRVRPGGRHCLDDERHPHHEQ